MIETSNAATDKLQAVLNHNFAVPTTAWALAISQPAERGLGL
jgi:hypothetical protein